MDTAITRHAAFRLRHDGESLTDQHGADFDVISYSRFKYGNASIARSYGALLAQLFIDNEPELAATKERVVVTGPSYKYLGTASQAIVATFSLFLNAYRIRQGLEPVIQMHIIRSWVGTDSYAMAGVDERRAMLANSTHHVDDALVAGSVVIAIDDINVTGATEERMHHRLLPCGPSTICYLHVAKIDEEQALANSAIEDVMNKSYPLSLANIELDVVNDDFILNSRVFRTIIETDDLDELSAFLERRTDAFLERMYDALVGGTVEMYQRHPKATALLERIVTDRKLIGPAT